MNKSICDDHYQINVKQWQNRCECLQMFAICITPYWVQLHISISQWVIRPYLIDYMFHGFPQYKFWPGWQAKKKKAWISLKIFFSLKAVMWTLIYISVVPCLQVMSIEQAKQFVWRSHQPLSRIPLYCSCAVRLTKPSSTLTIVRMRCHAPVTLFIFFGMEKK